MPSVGAIDALEVSAPDPETVSLLLAPDFIGNFLGWFLYGLLVLQIYQYRQGSSFDRHSYIAVTVYGVFLLETALTVITTRVTYTLLCSSWGVSNALYRLSRLDAFIPVIDGLVSGWVQAFYAWRIFGLSTLYNRAKRPWKCIPGQIILMMGASTGAALYYGFHTINFTDIRALESARAALIVWLLISALCDTFIASGMIFMLYRAHRLIDLPKDIELRDSPTIEWFKRIVFISLETCLLTTIATIVMLVLFIVMPHSRLPTMMLFITSKLYSNSLLVSITSVHRQREREAQLGTTDSAPLDTLAFRQTSRGDDTLDTGTTMDGDSTKERLKAT